MLLLWWHDTFGDFYDSSKEPSAVGWHPNADYLELSGLVCGCIMAQHVQHYVGSVMIFITLPQKQLRHHFLQSGKVEHAVVNAWDGGGQTRQMKEWRGKETDREKDRQRDRQRERQTSLGSSGYVPGKVGLLCPREVRGICCIANWWSLVNCGAGREVRTSQSKWNYFRGHSHLQTEQHPYQVSKLD